MPLGDNLFYIFQAEIRSFRGKELVINSEPLLRACEPHWWLAQPFVTKPEVFRIILSNNAPLADNLYVSSGIDVYSETLIQLMDNFGVKFELIDTSLVFKSGLPNSESKRHKAFHLLEIEDAIDVELSDIKISKSGKSIESIRKLVLKNDIFVRQPPMFRLAMAIDLVVINSQLKKSIEQTGLTGCLFTPLENWSQP
jgi:hypothetical protein